MQNKGFGSFMPEEYLNNINECKLKDDVAKWLKISVEQNAVIILNLMKI